MTEQRRVHLTPYWRLIVRRWLASAICSLAITTVVCGLSGFSWQYASSASPQTKPTSGDSTKPTLDDKTKPTTDDGTKPTPNLDWSIPLFKTVQLFLLNSGAEDDSGHPSNWFLMIARLSAATLFLVVSGTVIIRVLDEVRRLPSLLTRHDHVVICGLGEIGLQLLDDLESLDRAKDVVIIENDAANPWLEYARKLGASVVVGDATKSDTLIESRILHSTEVFVVTGDDGVNLEVVAELGTLQKNSKFDRQENRIRVHVHIVDSNFAATLRPYCKLLHDSIQMLVQVFNVPRTGTARLVANQLWPYAPKNTQETAHFVIFGFGPMGQTLAVQLAQLGHFPNHKRSRFTIADRDISQSARPFLSRYPRFTSWTNGDNGQLGVTSFSPEVDRWNWNQHPLPSELTVASADAIQYVCNAEFVELAGGRSDEVFAIRLAQLFALEGVKPVIFICGHQDHDNFEMAVQLRDQLTSHGHSSVPVFVWLPRQPALAEAISRNKNGTLIPFGECHSAASYSEITDPIRESLGRKIHEAYEQSEGEKAKAIGKTYEINPWSIIPDDHRESNRAAADHMLIKLRHVGVEIARRTTPDQRSDQFTEKLTDETRQTLAEMEHYRWVAERLLAGWRYIPKGQSDDEIKAYKKRNFNHNITPFELSETDKSFDQIDVIYEECQHLEGFILKRLVS